MFKRFWFPLKFDRNATATGVVSRMKGHIFMGIATGRLFM